MRRPRSWLPITASSQRQNCATKSLIHPQIQIVTDNMAILDSAKPNQYGPRGLKGRGLPRLPKNSRVSIA
jgi:hypothetical protein